MLRLILTFFYLSSLNFLSGVRTTQIAYIGISTKAFVDPCIDCACAPDFAGPDMFTCKQTPTQSVQIGCPLDLTNPQCLDLCFLWSPAPGLNPADAMKSNPTVNPTVTTEYTVTVKNTKLPAPNECGMYKVKVYVIEMELIVFKPKVIATNTITLANPVVGAQTFVNLDNDDNDIYFDNAKFEPTTGGVVGGDDELVRAELRLKPVDLPDKIVRLVATQGAADIKVWTDESKSGADYLLNTDIILNLDGAYLKKDLWIEGVSAHSVQQGTKLKMTYKGMDCGTMASITVLGVENISWIGNGNSVANSNNLDADPNYFPPNPIPATWPSAVRVFPDARVPAYTVPLNSVQLEVTLSVTPVEPVVMYVRSFDVDDPTNNSNGGLPGPPDPNFLQFLDPNDDPASPSGFYSGTNNSLSYTIHEDNRSSNPKAGAFTGQIGNSASIPFTSASSTKKIDFPSISMHPGDSYRAVVNGDKDFLENLENLDNRDEYKIVDKFALGLGTTPLEILLPLKYASPVLTIWRFLHVEGDQMNNFSDISNGNSLKVTFRDFAGTLGEGNQIFQLQSADVDIRQNQDPFPIPMALIPDNSPVNNTIPMECKANGRFDFGEVKVLNDLPGMPGIMPVASIGANDNSNLFIFGNLNTDGVFCSFDHPTGMRHGTARLTRVRKTGLNSFEWSLNSIVMTPAGTTLGQFNMGTFYINNSNAVPITGVNPASKIIMTSQFALTTRLYDDDLRSAASTLPHSPSLSSMGAYEKCYVKAINIGGSNNISFDSNLGDDILDFSQVNMNNSMLNPPGTITENDSYWGVYALSAWQGEDTRDIDGNTITKDIAVAAGGTCFTNTGEIELIPYSGWTYTEGLPITDLLLNNNITQGANHSYIYAEIIREAGGDRSITLAHEIGHQFGLGHGDMLYAGVNGAVIPECCFPTTMGLMASVGTTNATNMLIPRYQNLIRSRKRSPGF